MTEDQGTQLLLQITTLQGQVADLHTLGQWCFRALCVVVFAVVLVAMRRRA